MRAFSRLRLLCERRLGDIPVPAPFDLESFAASVSRRRSRRLRVLELPGLDGTDALSGAWVADDETDYILVDAAASPWHRNLIGLHEIAHLLCDHRADHRWPAEVSALLAAPGTDGGLALPGHAYGRAEEREADLLAGLVLEKSTANPVPVLAPGHEGTAGRLAQALLHPVRHD